MFSIKVSILKNYSKYLDTKHNTRYALTHLINSMRSIMSIILIKKLMECTHTHTHTQIYRITKTHVTKKKHAEHNDTIYCQCAGDGGNFGSNHAERFT